jgi:hypothetical protein
MLTVILKSLFQALLRNENSDAGYNLEAFGDTDATERQICISF